MSGGCAGEEREVERDILDAGGGAIAELFEGILYGTFSHASNKVLLISGSGQFSSISDLVCFRAARNKVDCRWETMFSPLELQNALRGLRQAAGLMGLSEAWDWERRARHEEAGELKL